MKGDKEVVACVGWLGFFSAEGVPLLVIWRTWRHIPVSRKRMYYLLTSPADANIQSSRYCKLRWRIWGKEIPISRLTRALLGKSLSSGPREQGAMVGIKPRSFPKDRCRPEDCKSHTTAQTSLEITKYLYFTLCWIHGEESLQRNFFIGLSGHYWVYSLKGFQRVETAGSGLGAAGFYGYSPSSIHSLPAECARSEQEV